MKEYYKVIDNKWGNDCPCFGLNELARAIQFAKDCQSYCDEFKTMDHNETPFKVTIVKVTSEIVIF